jgi:hypothetical protein
MLLLIGENYNRRGAEMQRFCSVIILNSVISPFTPFLSGKEK